MAVSAVIARRPRTISLMRIRARPVLVAKSFWLSPSGSRNSVRRISPGVLAAAFPDSPAMRDVIAKHQQAADAAKNLGDKAATSASSVSSLGTSASSAAGALKAIGDAAVALAAKVAGISIPTTIGPSPVPGPPPSIAKPHALGGIFTRPHLGLIAEKGPEALIPLSGPNAGNGLSQFTVHSAPVINIGPGTDIAEFKSALEEHARHIAEEVHRIIQIDFEREAIV